MSDYAKGLEGVIANESALSDVQQFAEQRAEPFLLADGPVLLGPVLDDVECAGPDDPRHDRPEGKREDQFRIDSQASNDYRDYGGMLRHADLDGVLIGFCCSSKRKRHGYRRHRQSHQFSVSL